MKVHKRDESVSGFFIKLCTKKPAVSHLVSNIDDEVTCENCLTIIRKKTK